MGDRCIRRPSASSPDQSKVFRHVGVVLAGIFTNGLTAQRFLVTDVALGAELPQRAGDHELGHRVGPHRLHHERRHHHVAAEVRRVVGQAGHQLFFGAEQLGSSRVALELAIAGNGSGRRRVLCRIAACAIGSNARVVQKAQEGRIEDLIARERVSAGASVVTRTVNRIGRFAFARNVTIGSVTRIDASRGSGLRSS